MTVTCPQGHPSVDPAATFCLQCGAPLPVALGSCAVHPDRAATSSCPRCGTFACAECLVAQPDGGALCARCDARSDSQLPWDRRGELGTVRGFLRTTSAMMLRPEKTLAVTSPSATFGSSLSFLTIAGFIAGLTNVLLYVGLGAATVMVSATGEGARRAVILAVTLLVLGVLTTFALAVGGALVSATLDHGVLRLLGAKARSYRVTLKASALSLSPCWVALIPLFGIYGYALWALVIRVFAYRRLHAIGTAQALVGALAVPALVLLALITLVVLGGLGAFRETAGTD